MLVFTRGEGEEHFSQSRIPLKSPDWGASVWISKSPTCLHTKPLYPEKGALPTQGIFPPRGLHCAESVHIVSVAEI